MDALINNDYYSPTPTEKYILSFIDRLLKQTNADQLDWKKETVGKLRSVGCTGDCPNHPLFTLEYDENGLPMILYDSKFTPGFYVSDDCYYLTLPGVTNTILYLMCVGDPKTKEIPFAENFFELYMVQNWAVNPLCHSFPENSPFYTSLKTLYSAVNESCKHPKLESEVMSAIDAFMRVSAEIPPEEELPF